MSSDESAAETPKRKNLNVAERSAVIAELLKGSNNGILRKGDFTRVGILFQTNRRVIARLWTCYQHQKAAGVLSPDLHNKRRGNSGRKGHNIDALRQTLKDIPIKNRTTLRGLAAALGIPKTTLVRNLEKLGLRAVSRQLKPLLTNRAKKERLEWALRWTRPAGGGYKFHHFEDHVHLDEKWFYICQNGQTYYLCDDEELPIRKVRHKSHITKVMLLAAVARPRDIVARWRGARSFSGKIGIFPFTEQRQARRNSRNRAAGTMETKCVEVTKEVYKRKVIDEVIPAIREAWPVGMIRTETVTAQQDNAPAHNIYDDPDVLAACNSGNPKIRFIAQPANSPDTNILDLGFFNSIQSLQDRTTPRTVDELVAEVKRAFNEQAPATLGKVWTTLQAVLQEIMLAKGDNTFKLPHSKKDKAEKALSRELPCSPEAWTAAQAALSSLS